VTRLFSEQELHYCPDPARAEICSASVGPSTRDPRYEAFIERASLREILGVSFPVARVEDVLQGKIWAVSDEAQSNSKRQKDLADIARLLETLPHLRDAVPDEIQRRLL
jgi:hypothetical protein